MSEVVRWVGFHVLIIILLLIDLGFHRRGQPMKLKKAVLMSLFWIGLSLLFNVAVYFVDGPEQALEFFTGYLVEKSLSIDNLFIFLVIFQFFKVPNHLQYRVLYFGVIGAFVLRLSLILAGVALLEVFEWVVYIFGFIVLLTGVRIVQKKKHEIKIEKNLLVRCAKKIFPVTKDYVDEQFFVRQRGKLFATPLFLVLIVIESSDFLFALDSIPAIFSVTHNPFIIYTSNVFAVIGLRAMHFVLENFLGMFRYIKYGLGGILMFVGVKMLLSPVYTISLSVSLLVILGILILSVLLSLYRKK